MPDESDFRNYKSIEEFGKTLEGNKYFHDLYLKAVNHPVRREILLEINNINGLSEEELKKNLFEKNIIQNDEIFNYNVDYLIKALCIEKKLNKVSGKISYYITQEGKVIEYLDK
jgi:hypothetical protein